MTRQQQRAVEAFGHRGYYRGMGASQQQDASTIGSSLTQISAALAKIPGAQIAAPFVAIAGALANIVSLFGPNPNNTITTGWVNQIEADVLQPNLAAWQALAPADKSPEAQAAALAIFQEGWNQVVQLCSNMQLGSAGTSCIADRQNGACHWTSTGQTPGQPPNCGNWWTWYHDPIANDPQVAANEAAAASGSTSTGSSTSNSTTGATLGTTISNALGGMSPLAIGAALIGLALVVSE